MKHGCTRHDARTWGAGVNGLIAALLLAGALAGCGPATVTRPDEPAAPAADPTVPTVPAAPTAAEAGPAAPTEAPAAPEAAVGAEEEHADDLGPYDRARILLDEPHVVRLREKAPRAEALFQEALRLTPDRPEVHYNLGVLYLRTARRAEAQRSFERTLQLSPEFASAIAQLGFLKLRGGSAAEAQALFERAVAIEPYNAVARNGLAVLAIDREQYADAVGHARQALLGDSKSVNAYLALATCYFRLKRYEIGQLVCLNGLELNPHAAPLHNLMGLFFLQANDVRAAVQSFQTAIDSDPDLIEARMNFGAVMLSYGNFQVAFEQFEKVLQAEPENVDARLSRAVALRGLERYDEARAGYEDVIARDAGNLEARYNLCTLYQQYLENYEQALVVCEDFLGRIDKRHPKQTEMTKRVRGIRQTIETLRVLGEREAATPPAAPATEEPAAPVAEPPTP